MVDSIDCATVLTALDAIGDVVSGTVSLALSPSVSAYSSRVMVDLSTS